MLSSALFVTVGGQLIVSMFEITRKPDQNFIQLMVILVSILPGKISILSSAEDTKNVWKTDAFK